MVLRVFAYPTVSRISERVYRERAEYHGRDEREGTVQGYRMEPGSGSPGERTRIKMQAGFRR